MSISTTGSPAMRMLSQALDRGHGLVVPVAGGADSAEQAEVAVELPEPTRRKATFDTGSRGEGVHGLHLGAEGGGERVGEVDGQEPERGRWGAA